jgi:hypothetical protein
MYRIGDRFCGVLKPPVALFTDRPWLVAQSGIRRNQLVELINGFIN